MIYNQSEHQDDSLNKNVVKRRLAVTDSLNRYIDTCLIDEYATKDFKNGWTLDIDNLPKNEIENFLHELMQHDTNIRDLVLHEMQLRVEKRLPECEASAMLEEGFQRKHLSNGDSFLSRRMSW